MALNRTKDSFNHCWLSEKCPSGLSWREGHDRPVRHSRAAQETCVELRPRSYVEKG
jgi:hypothetical protein